MKHLYLTFLCLFFSAGAVLAQSRIYGTVTDAVTNTPIPEARVLFKGTNAGTSCNQNGNYSLFVPTDMLGDVVLVATNAGYKAQTIEVFASTGGSYKVDFTLRPGFEELRAVTVSAQKQLEDLQKVPLSVTSFGTSDLNDRSAASLFDLSGQLPNAYMETNTPVFSSAQIRGVSNLASSVSGVETNIGAYSDEGYMPRPYLYNLPLVDIERVEISRGPQGTLFGKNTIAGIYNYTSARPGSGLRGGVDLTYGGYNLMQGRGYFNFEPVKDKLFVRVAGIFRKRDGYLRNLTAGDLMAQQYWAGKAQILYRPTPTTSIHFIGEWGRYEGTGYAFDVAEDLLNDTLQLDPYDYSLSTNYTNEDNLDNHLAQLNISQGIGSWTLRSVSAFRSSGYFSRADRDATIYDLIVYEHDESSTFFSQELRIESDTAQAWHFLAGLYFDAHDQSGYDSLILGSDADIVLNIEIPGFREWMYSPSEIVSNSFAAFSNFRYRLGKWAFRAGLRYSYDIKEMNYEQEIQAQVGLIFTTVRPIAPRVDRYSRGALSADASIAYHFSPKSMAYARFARGYKAGGFSNNPIAVSDPDTLAFEPEFLNNTELGFKSTWFENRLSANVAVFFMQYFDKQEVVRSENQYIVNNADINSIGAELELAAVPVSGLILGGGIGYTNATYGTFVTQTITGVGDTLTLDYTGNTTPHTPRWMGSAFAQYNFDFSDNFGITLRGDYMYRGSAFLQLSNLEEFSQNSNSRVNARIGFNFLKNRYSLSVWGRNLTGTKYPIVGQTLLSARYLMLNEPLMWGVEVRATF